MHTSFKYCLIFIFSLVFLLKSVKDVFDRKMFQRYFKRFNLLKQFFMKSEVERKAGILKHAECCQALNNNFETGYIYMLLV